MPAAPPPRQSLLLDCPVSGRAAWVALERGHLEVDGHCLALVQQDGVVEIPPAAFAALLIEPGVSLTHAAVRLCAENSTAIIWVGEAGSRIYAASHLHAHAERLVRQAALHLNERVRIEAARRLYAMMFGEPARPSLTIEKLRGIEGAWVRSWYQKTALSVGIEWDHRGAPSELQRCISYASGCLNDLCQIAIVILGYSPALGVVHSGDARSFVFDLADTVKFEPLLQEVFVWFSVNRKGDFTEVRRFCRDAFLRLGLLDKVIINANYIIDGNPRGNP